MQVVLQTLEKDCVCKYIYIYIMDFFYLRSVWKLKKLQNLVVIRTFTNLYL